MRKIIFLLFTILAAWQVKAADKVRFVAEAADVAVSIYPDPRDHQCHPSSELWR